MRKRSSSRGIQIVSRRGSLQVAALASLLLAQSAHAQFGPRLPVDADGTVHVPAMSVPVSDFLSPEGKAYVAKHLRDLVTPGMVLLEPSGVPPLIAPYVPRAYALYPVNREERTIAGVRAYVYTPKQGVSPGNRKRVLINLHGGAFRE